MDLFVFDLCFCYKMIMKSEFEKVCVGSSLVGHFVRITGRVESNF